MNADARRQCRVEGSWNKIPDRLKDFCDWLNAERVSLSNKTPEQIYSVSFESHYRLVSIHPWADGNGRMARLLMNLIQYEAGVVLSIVKKEQRIQYIEALARAQENKDWKIFRDFMMWHHIENLEQQITEFTQSLNGDETINDTLNETINDIIKLPEKERVILDIMILDPDVTITGILNQTGFSRPTVNRVIKSLKEKGLLNREGSKKTGKWKAGRI